MNNYGGCILVNHSNCPNYRNNQIQANRHFLWTETQPNSANSADNIHKKADDI